MSRRLGPVDIDVPRDRDGSFEPIIVCERQRRLDGIDQIVLFHIRYTLDAPRIRSAS